MIQSVLINPANLQQIAQYRLILKEILLADSSLKTKIAIITSFKHTLELALQRESKKMEWLVLEERKSQREFGAIHSQSANRDSQRMNVSASLSMRINHKALINRVCLHFELRDHLSISLCQLQQEVQKLAYNYHKQAKNHDKSGQTKSIRGFRQAHAKMRESLTALSSARASIAVEYEMLTDNIKLLRVKNALLKKELALVKASQFPTKEKQEKRGELSNENRNQILVNL